MSTQIDFGSKPEKESEAPVASSPSPSKTTYPQFTLRDSVCEDMESECPCKVKGRLRGYVELEKSGEQNDEFGRSCTFKVLGFTPEGDAEEPGEEKEMEQGDEEEAPKKPYQRRVSGRAGLAVRLGRKE